MAIPLEKVSRAFFLLPPLTQIQYCHSEGYQHSRASLTLGKSMLTPNTHCPLSHVFKNVANSEELFPNINEIANADFKDGPIKPCHNQGNICIFVLSYLK